ncbi:zinc finger protein 576 isoform X1 [Canis lupus baileyi]|uniref:zinc finger protein 576 isoform X1 n=1 Tax=Canis lupus dingo TaxID=286419 RepID=UPI0012340600|nr:zinc finger protein 576 isoform X1 [Canis lupus dingo]XP_035568430.1 zinc finger protein 576 isoform X1 [Canis lupus dingo]XP_035568431.1 zinc finger protein 576 isoform X1 [Canis lupus dingo]XP_038291712.1 zinc finger protein 576 isoform X2 [Canis lupus familiaris]XP_038291778.1 zinc finger protein 576 isoform X2 [Canis lupus familiaris]XP_038291849.1 zinc finger protein 576 isoform X2 [Canis lupus familiaris]XP_038384623.1 zinc finger protein 576 isoform X2 [Canis lupus familiaris]XP_03
MALLGEHTPWVPFLTPPFHFLASCLTFQSLSLLIHKTSCNSLPVPLSSPDVQLAYSHLGAPQCTRCLITFADSKFQERHMKREHPADFVAQKLQGALFICFTCARSFPSSKALLAHQRSHGPAARPSTPVAPTAAHPTFPCPDCGKTFGQAASLRRHRQAHETRVPPGPFACTECGQDFAQEAGLHQHYIRHARGEL